MALNSSDETEVEQYTNFSVYDIYHDCRNKSPNRKNGYTKWHRKIYPKRVHVESKP